MNTNQLIGTVIVVGVPLVVSIIALIRPIINLNTSITKLNVTMEQLIEDNDYIKNELKEINETLNDHEKRIWIAEHRRNENNEQRD